MYNKGLLFHIYRDPKTRKITQKKKLGKEIKRAIIKDKQTNQFMKKNCNLFFNERNANKCNETPSD